MKNAMKNLFTLLITSATLGASSLFGMEAPIQVDDSGVLLGVENKTRHHLLIDIVGDTHTSSIELDSSSNSCIEHFQQDTSLHTVRVWRITGEDKKEFLCEKTFDFIGYELLTRLEVVYNRGTIDVIPYFYV